MASFDKFRESSSNANAYPSNLLRTEAWPHELRRCREELEGFEQRSEDDPRLFDDYSSIYALDYLEVEMCK